MLFWCLHPFSSQLRYEIKKWLFVESFRDFGCSARTALQHTVGSTVSWLPSVELFRFVFKPFITLCLLLMWIFYYSVLSSASCLYSNRFLPFVPLQHVGDTMDGCRLKWTVQTGGTATEASTLSLVTPLGNVTSCFKSSIWHQTLSH